MKKICISITLILSLVSFFSCSRVRTLKLDIPEFPNFNKENPPKLVSQKKLDKAQIYYEKGMQYENEGFLDKATTEYEQAVKVTPDHFEAMYALARVYYKNGNRHLAVEKYKEALKIQPDNPELHNDIGNVYMELNKLDEAIEEYLKATDFNPKYAMAYTNLGIMFSTRKYMIDKATYYYNKAINLNNDLRASAISHYQLGIIHFYKGEEQAAINQYKFAVEKFPDYAPPYFKLGEIYARRMKNDEAVLHFENFLRVVKNLKSEDAKKARRFLRKLKK